MPSQRRAASREESVALYHTQLVYNTCLGCPKGQCFFGVVSLADRWRNPGGSSQDVGHFSPQVKTTEMVVRVPPRME
ncbi:hypothetical protein BON22_1036 [Cyberlindnera fabianii]|uniref:Uncharacterized protein n=1 Tax=Cyberlindnera fabianii TaxID=36022 RepID=A0A1V2LBQ3_CYBFA|nr:hypothetical protein BON22_1036 [Cyberlindnera fabianii]